MTLGETNMTGSQEMMAPTPTTDVLPRRFSDFETLGEALDYAEQGVRGLNFHDARGNLARPYPFSELRSDAIACAHRLIAHGVKPQDRVALVAETGVAFAQLFFGIIYAGAWPVPLPLPTSFGGKESYIDQLNVQLSSCDPMLFLFPQNWPRWRVNRAVRSRSKASHLKISSPVMPFRPSCPGRRRRTSPICNIRAGRPVSRMALR